MPTGYTADVGDGKVTEFAVFAMQCARAFGALITMRDDPSKAPIPQRLEPSTHYRDWLEEARTKLRALESLTPEQVAERCSAEYAETEASRLHYKAKGVATRERYEAMLSAVENWTPPTAEHVELKRFMAQQLTESIKFDCSSDYYDTPTPIVEPSEWHAEQIKSAHDTVKRYAAEWEAEQQRTESRNRWIEALRGSLKEHATA